jgi:hypothetical protein
MHVIPVSHEVGFTWAAFHIWARRLGVGELRCTATVGSKALFIRLIICTFQLVFSVETIFFSHNKLANSVFSVGLSAQLNGAKNGWHQTGRKSPVTFVKEVRESGLQANMLKF